MRIRFLGTGTSYGVPRLCCDCSVCTSTDSRNRRLRSSVVIEGPEGRLLIDVTPDFRAQALASGIRDLGGVLITHCHADHFFGMDDLRGITDQRTTPLSVFASQSSSSELRKVFSYAFPPVGSPRVPGLPYLELRTVHDRVALEACGFRVLPIAAPHGRGVTFGYVVGGAAYFTDVSDLPETVVSEIRGVEVLILDMLQLEPHPTHLHLARSLEIASRVGARQTWFIHMGHEIDHASVEAMLPHRMHLAFDGAFVDL